MTSDIQQQLDSKQGEITYRRKLALQQSSDGQVILPEAHTKQEILKVMQERIAQTREDMRAIIAKDVRLSPYVEVGAGRCQRALVLGNEFGASGFALDISLDMLRYASVIAENFGFTEMPIRIACDAYDLPFRNETIAFAFCYQTLHHFPSPLPICGEISRALQTNGVLFFDDEPVKGYIKKLTRIYHRKGHRLGTFERLISRFGLLTVVSKGDELGREHGVLEEEFDISTWQRALSSFRPMQIVVNRKLRIRMRSLNWSANATLAHLVGGNIQVLASKINSQKQESRPANENLLDLLGCPNCADKPKLVPLPMKGLECPQCGNNYPQVDGVLLLFEKNLGKRLYPEYLS